MTADPVADAAARLRALGVDRVESYAWRDLDDPDAGGSEVHADEILSRWAAHGIEIVHRTSTADTGRSFRRNGYTVIQRGGRFGVFPRVILRQLFRRRPDSTATVEVWNGVPWFGPIWAPRRRVVWMHHLHRDMWEGVLPRPLSDLGRFLESRAAPWWYRNSTFWTPSASSAREIEQVGIPAAALHVIPNGVHERFVPDPTRRHAEPTVLVVGRLAAVKRQRLVLEALAAVRSTCPCLVRIVGDGPDRAAIERWIAERDAGGWVTLVGRATDEELVAEYQAAWVVASASLAEGWGMVLTEAGACATPAVATDIPGHRDAVIDGVTGRLVAEPALLGPTIAELLVDPYERDRLGSAAVTRASELNWSTIAARHLGLLCDAIERDRRRVRSARAGARRPSLRSPVGGNIDPCP